jgi:hypothetical protein
VARPEIRYCLPQLALGRLAASAQELHLIAEGRKLAAAAAHQKIEASVDDAIRKVKITPARRKHWINLIGADPGMADVLASVPNETAVPLTEVGHSVSAENGGNDFAESATWFH